VYTQTHFPSLRKIPTQKVATESATIEIKGEAMYKYRFAGIGLAVTISLATILGGAAEAQSAKAQGLITGEDRRQQGGHR
jgi:hypothetical protein